MGYYNSPRWSAEIADCSMPMTMDTYSNCSYKCKYCFSQFQRGIGDGKENYLNNDVKWVNSEKFKKIFTNPDESQFGLYVKSRKAMQWGGLSDQFDENERKYGKTLELLRWMRENVPDMPISFSTKATWWLDDPRYIELFKGNSMWNCKFSIITLDEKKARIIETGVDSPSKRLNAIEKYAKLNAGGATLRLRPFIIGITTPSYLDLIRRAGDCGATALSTEFLCIERRSNLLKSKFHFFTELCGFDLYEFYIKYSVQQGYLRLNRKIKEPFIRNMKSECEKIGMRFYVSDAHFKECSCNGSCCGLPESWNYSRGQWCQALMLARKNGRVTYSEVKVDIDKYLSGFMYKMADGFNTKGANIRAKFNGMSMADYMRWLWNNPNNGQSPYVLFEGVLYPVDKDNDGDLVYEYQENRTFVPIEKSEGVV